MAYLSNEPIAVVCATERLFRRSQLLLTLWLFLGQHPCIGRRHLAPNLATGTCMYGVGRRERSKPSPSIFNHGKLRYQNLVINTVGAK